MPPRSNPPCPASITTTVDGRLVCPSDAPGVGVGRAVRAASLRLARAAASLGLERAEAKLAADNQTTMKLRWRTRRDISPPSAFPAAFLKASEENCSLLAPV